MDLKPIDPRITAKLLEGYKDTITEAAKQREQFYHDQICPYCQGTELRRHGDIRFMFRPNDPLPHYQLTCMNCDCLFDPHSGIVLKIGNLGKALVPAFPIIGGSED